MGCDYAAGVGLLVLQGPFCFLGVVFLVSWKHLVKEVDPIANAAELQLQLSIFLRASRFANQVGQRVILPGILQQPVDALQAKLQRQVVRMPRLCVAVFQLALVDHHRHQLKVCPRR